MFLILKRYQLLLLRENLISGRTIFKRKPLDANLMSPYLILVDLDAEEFYQFANAFCELGSILLLGF